MAKATKKWNREVILNELNILSKKLNRAPSARDSPELYQACRRYFGSFNKAKEFAGLNIRVYENRVKNKTISKDLCYILGVVFGDGYIRIRKDRGRTSGEVALEVKDKDFGIKFKRSLERWSKCNVKFFRRYDGLYHVGLYSVSAAKIIKDFNLKLILLLPPKMKCLFIKGMFDSEGGVIGLSLNRRKKAKRWVSFSNSNKNLIRIISCLLDEFNINYSLKSRIHSGFGSKKRQYEIIIYGLKNLINFKKHISFSIKRKQKKLIDVINSYGSVKYGKRSRYSV